MAGLLDTAFIFTSPNQVKHCAIKLHLPSLTSKAYNDDRFHRLKPHTFHWLILHTFHWLMLHTFHRLMPHIISQTQTIHILQTQTTHISQTQSAHISQTHTAHISQTQTTHISQTQTTHISQTPNILKQLLSLSHSFQLLPTATNNPNHATTTWHRSPLTLLRLFWK